MPDIMLDFERLNASRAGLAASVAEFEHAGDINDGLEDAIGRPDDRGELRGKTSDFESDWDGKRGKLKDNLQTILDQLDSIIEGWQEWDTGTAADLEGGGTTTQNGPV